MTLPTSTPTNPADFSLAIDGVLADVVEPQRSAALTLLAEQLDGCAWRTTPIRLLARQQAARARAAVDPHQDELAGLDALVESGAVCVRVRR